MRATPKPSWPVVSRTAPGPAPGPEVVSFTGNRFGTFTFGTRDNDRHDTPFRLGLLPEGLTRFGLVRLPNGLFLFSGGMGYNFVEKRYYVTDKTGHHQHAQYAERLGQHLPALALRLNANEPPKRRP